MAKILLVEDDNNLREIYEARLQAEGYDIVSARDGEEALTVAMKERPDLIISDVMMPKISGFDMLDIIRSTEETKNAKVIMMTALSQAEDKARAEKLGADRYLVKSQVTLEDVAKVAREVLGGETPSAKPTQSPIASPNSTAIPPATPPVEPPKEPMATSVVPQIVPITTAPPVPPVVAEPASNNLASVQPTVAPVQNASLFVSTPITPSTDTGGTSDDDEQRAIAEQIESFIDSKRQEPAGNSVAPQTAPEAVIPVSIVPAPEHSVSTPSPLPSTIASPDTTSKKVIEPIIDSAPQTNLGDLLKKEEERDQMANVAKQLVSNQAAPAPNPFPEPASLETKPATSAPEVQLDTVRPQPVTSDVPPTTTFTPSTPPAPTSTGTNIDGVIQSASPNTQNSDSVDDPNSISL